MAHTQNTSENGPQLTTPILNSPLHSSLDLEDDVFFRGSRLELSKTSNELCSHSMTDDASSNIHDETTGGDSISFIKNDEFSNDMDDLTTALMSTTTTSLYDNDPSCASLPSCCRNVYHACRVFFNSHKHLLTNNLFPDDVVRFKGVLLMEGPEGIRLLKFWILTILMILVVKAFVSGMGWEHDANYSYSDFFLYDFPSVFLDSISFFLISRLHQRRGTDALVPYIIPMTLGAIYPSWSANLKFLQHSVTMYEIMCTWPWETFVYVVIAACVIAWIVYKHARYMYTTSLLPSRLFVLSLMISCFLLPYLFNPNFHFHHWYACWLFGMHCNVDTWWSLATMAFLWGGYANGIAVYGRDPILSCEYAFYLATDIKCPFMDCYTQDDDDGGGGYKPFVEPNWRNCSAEDNYNPL